MDQDIWQVFDRINRNRRAVKYFTGDQISDADMEETLTAAQRAPSSFNLQPYELHWIRSAPACNQMRKACKGQRAANAASAFVVVVAKWDRLIDTYDCFLRYVEESRLYEEKSKKYFRSKRKQIAWFLKLTPLWVFSWLKGIVSVFSRHFILAPIGRAGLYQWAAKNSISAAQTLMLAAQAKGIDTCPMEGFNAHKVSKVLRLKRGVIPVVIALGKRSDVEPLTPPWRKPFEHAVVVH
jgi:nitroreductase